MVVKAVAAYHLLLFPYGMLIAKFKGSSGHHAYEGGARKK
jgi:hypothetical protein